MNYKIRLIFLNGMKKEYSQKKTQTISFLPDSLHSSNSSADIHFSDDGKNLYASVRGINQIKVLAVSTDQKSVTLTGSEGNGINWPRNFTLDPTGKFLPVANQKGNDIIVFYRDKNTGMISPASKKIELSMPVCLKF